mgnify:FL=1
MIVRFVQYPHFIDPLYGVHFPRELPIIPMPTGHSGPRRISRQTNLCEAGHYMAAINQGQFSVEVTEPQAAYQRFLENLVFLPGVVSILNSDRYSIRLIVARFFSPATVLRKVSKLTCHHFYPGEMVHPENGGQITISGQDNAAANAPSYIVDLRK